MRSMSRRLFSSSICAFAATSIVALSAPAQAAPDALGKPVAHFSLEAKSADIGIGFTWGEGKLTYKGRTYRFKVSGGNIAAVGFSKITATGTVYNLKNLHDFDGGYAALSGDATLDRGIGGAVMSNSNGVKVKFTSATRGAHLAAGAQGLSFQIREK